MNSGNIMLKRILIAIDGSRHAHRAVVLGSEIAARFDAEVVLIHVLVEEPTEQEVTELAQLVRGLGPQAFPPLHMDDLVRAMAGRAEAPPVQSQHEALVEIGQHLLEQAAATVRENGAEVIRRDLLPGKAPETIVEATNAVNADLVVLGSRGLGGVQGWVLGSVSQYVTRHVSASCLTVH